MNIIFDEIVGKVTDDQPQQEEEKAKETRPQRPLSQATFRHIQVQIRRHYRLKERLRAD